MNIMTRDVEETFTAWKNQGAAVPYRPHIAAPGTRYRKVSVPLVNPSKPAKLHRGETKATWLQGRTVLPATAPREDNLWSRKGDTAALTSQMRPLRRAKHQTNMKSTLQPRPLPQSNLPLECNGPILAMVAPLTKPRCHNTRGQHIQQRDSRMKKAVGVEVELVILTHGIATKVTRSSQERTNPLKEEVPIRGCQTRTGEKAITGGHPAAILKALLQTPANNFPPIVIKLGITRPSQERIKSTERGRE